jgi:hypothetical protein
MAKHGGGKGFFWLVAHEFDELNKMLLEVRIGNSLCAFHLIHTILDIANNFLFAF